MSVVLTPEAATVAAGDTVRFTATALDVNGSPMENVDFEWAASDTSVAWAGRSGLAFGWRAGSATVSVRTDRGVSASADVTVEGELEVERFALTRLYARLRGWDWRESGNWLTDAPLADWHGVSVSPQTGCSARTSARPDTPPAVAVTTVEPARSAVTSPAWSTTTTSVSPEVHSNSTPSTSELSASSAVATRRTVSPSATVATGGVTVIEATVPESPAVELASPSMGSQSAGCGSPRLRAATTRAPPKEEAPPSALAAMAAAGASMSIARTRPVAASRRMTDGRSVSRFKNAAAPGPLRATSARSTHSARAGSAKANPARPSPSSDSTMPKRTENSCSPVADHPFNSYRSPGGGGVKGASTQNAGFRKTPSLSSRPPHRSSDFDRAAPRAPAGETYRLTR
ncbi:MAG: Ig-like domain-containing protein [Gemmatimonadota bacterium]|nr:Ig-like domain-containing protein [Gemmatimonadota bacterium]